MDQDAPCLTMMLEILKVLAALLGGAVSAVLGFRFARQMEGVKASKMLRARVMEICDQIADIDDGTIPGVDFEKEKHAATIKLYMRSIPKLRVHVFAAMDSMTQRQREETGQAWQKYRTLKPHRHRMRDYDDMRGPPFPEQIFDQAAGREPKPREKCARDVILKGLYDLRDSIPV